jgi:ParB-like chromosome segregation protein Spo0J
MSLLPPLKPLHPVERLNAAKLALFEKLSTESLMQSLSPGQQHCLKTRPDGTMLDGHHRTRILELRGIDVNALPREVLESEGF